MRVSVYFTFQTFHLHGINRLIFLHSSLAEINSEKPQLYIEPFHKKRYGYFLGDILGFPVRACLSNKLNWRRETKIGSMFTKFVV